MFETMTQGGCGRGHRFAGGGEGSRGGGWMGGRGGARDGMGRGPDGRGPGGRRRVFDGGELRLVLLRLIADTPRHGYDLIRAIEELTGGAYAPSPGIVYPTLTLLSEMGLIAEQAPEGARKLFAVTPEGTAHLAERASEIASLLARLASLGAEQEKTNSAPMRRAMLNLRTVLQHRLGEGLDTETLHAAVALIDDAAQKIERL